MDHKYHIVIIHTGEVVTPISSSREIVLTTYSSPVFYTILSESYNIADTYAPLINRQTSPAPKLKFVVLTCPATSKFVSCSHHWPVGI